MEKELAYSDLPVWPKLVRYEAYQAVASSHLSQDFAGGRDVFQERFFEYEMYFGQGIFYTCGNKNLKI